MVLQDTHRQCLIKTLQKALNILDITTQITQLCAFQEWQKLIIMI